MPYFLVQLQCLVLEFQGHLKSSCIPPFAHYIPCVQWAFSALPRVSVNLCSGGQDGRFANYPNSPCWWVYLQPKQKNPLV